MIERGPVHPPVAGHQGESVGERASGVRAVARPGPSWEVRSGPPVVALALGVSVAAMVVLHLIGVGRLDPLTTTVSDYVSVPDGTALLAVAVLALAVAAAAVAWRTRAHWSGPVLGVGCVGLLATAAFPTNALGTPETVDTVLHRYVAALFFVGLTIAAIALLRHRPSALLRRWTVISVLAGIAFLVSHVPLLLPDLPGAPVIAELLPRGLVERGLLAVDMVLLARMARCAIR